jgi:hypothetical protein
VGLLSWIIVSRINPVSSHGEHAQWCCDVESEVQDPWNLSEVGLICSSAEEKERGCGKFRENDSSLLRYVVLTSSVRKR